LIQQLPKNKKEERNINLSSLEKSRSKNKGGSKKNLIVLVTPSKTTWPTTKKGGLRKKTKSNGQKKRETETQKGNW